MEFKSINMGTHEPKINKNQIRNILSEYKDQIDSMTKNRNYNPMAFLMAVEKLVEPAVLTNNAKDWVLDWYSPDSRVIYNA